MSKHQYPKNAQYPSTRVTCDADPPWHWKTSSLTRSVRPTVHQDRVHAKRLVILIRSLFGHWLLGIGHSPHLSLAALVLLSAPVGSTAPMEQARAVPPLATPHPRPLSPEAGARGEELNPFPAAAPPHNLTTCIYAVVRV